MHDDFLINRLTGRWIVQSTNYSVSANTLINQVECINIKDCSSYFKSTIDNLEKYEKELSGINLYCMQFKDRHDSNSQYYILLIYQASTLKLVMKFNHSFVFLSKFIVQSQSRNCLTIISCDKNIEVIEKIYFLSRNLKIIKSTIQQDNSYIGTSFSSEIRIG